jgi:hypothetical protein
LERFVNRFATGPSPSDFNLERSLYAESPEITKQAKEDDAKNGPDGRTPTPESECSRDRCGDRDAEPVQSFGSFTADLHRMARWLKDCRIQTVVMQATGVYWTALYDVLES